MIKNIKTWFLISLCLNLGLLGLIAGGAYRAHSNLPPDGPHDEVGAIMFAVPGHVRDEIRNQFQKSFNMVNEERANSFDEMINIIAADELDVNKLRAYFDQTRQNNAKWAAEAHQSLIEQISKMTLEERKAMAASLGEKKDFGHQGHR